MASYEDRLRELEREKERLLRQLGRDNKRAADAEQRARAAEEQLRPTDYLSYLSLCHHKLFMPLSIRTKSDLISAGGVANVKNKHYPLYLKKWLEFPSLHSQCQQRLQAAFGAKEIFQPAHGVDMVRDLFADVPVADEEDMKQFQFFAVEAAVKFVANKFFSPDAQPSPDQALPDSSTRPARIRFLNNPYGLLALDLDDDVTDDTLAYPPRVYPDQWCFQVRTDGVYLPVFVVQYKAPLKFPPSVIVEALQNQAQSMDTTDATRSTGEAGNDNDVDADTKLFMDVIDALHDKDSTESSVSALANAKTVTAQVIARAFHYMVEFGLCYAYIVSGDALLFLHLQPSDPRTLYYHLALPKKDMCSAVADAGYSPENQQNTAVALVLSLLLMGCDTPVLTQRWKHEAYSVLKVWPDPYPEMGEENNGKGSDLVKTKPDFPTPKPQAGCKDPTETKIPHQEDNNDDKENNDLYELRKNRSTKGTNPHSATTSSQQNPFDPFCKPSPTNVLPYCTQACLLGVLHGGPLDRCCPNVGLHERAKTPGCHPLTTEQLVKRLRAQLAEDLDDDCEGLDKYGKFGSTSILFRLVLRPYGYCFVGKGVQRPHAWLLEHELGIYEAVAAQQGQLVPVCLGLLELDQEYISYTGAHISNMLLLSYGGEPMRKRKDSSLSQADEAHAQELINQAWANLDALGVVHGDEREANVVWNEERQAVMCIDFGTAQIR